MPKIDFISDEAEAKSKPLNSFSPKKIHLELTEDQVSYLRTEIYMKMFELERSLKDYEESHEGFKASPIYKNRQKELAFVKRIYNTLAKAKTSTT